MVAGDLVYISVDQLEDVSIVLYDAIGVDELEAIKCGQDWIDELGDEPNLAHFLNNNPNLIKIEEKR